jgi:hypothetical protein
MRAGAWHRTNVPSRGYRLGRECGRLQVFEHEIVGRVVDRTDLLDDDVLLTGDFVGIEAGVRQDVGQHVEPERDIGLEDARVIGRHLDPGAGVEIAADGFDLLGDLPRGATRRSFERHVLEEMRDAVLVRLLVAAAARHPAAERGGLQVRHPVGDHDQSGRETGDFDAHAGTPSRAARL